MEFTWSDYGDDKHFHILDTDTREITPVRNPLTIHKKVFYDDTKETLMSIKTKDFSHLKNCFVSPTNRVFSSQVGHLPGITSALNSNFFPVINLLRLYLFKN